MTRSKGYDHTSQMTDSCWSVVSKFQNTRNVCLNWTDLATVQLPWKTMMSLGGGKTIQGNLVPTWACYLHYATINANDSYLVRVAPPPHGGLDQWIRLGQVTSWTSCPMVCAACHQWVLPRPPPRLQEAIMIIRTARIKFHASAYSI